MVKSNWSQSATMLLLALLIVADCAMYLRIRADVARRNDQGRDSIFRLREQGAISPPEGFTAEGVKVDIPGKRAGWAIRYAARECEYCKKDDGIWNNLGSTLQGLGYSVIVISATAKSGYSSAALTPNGALQEAFINMEWLKRFRLTVEPTVLIFGPDQQLIWGQQGIMGPNDYSSALRTVEKAGANNK